MLRVYHTKDESNVASVVPYFLKTASKICIRDRDDIQDPGNLGTIIRLADWFGIEHIICSQNTVDVYNPKTIQATMGGIARVKVHYTSLPEFIHSLGDAPVFGTFLDGENMYEQPLSLSLIHIFYINKKQTYKKNDL